MNTKNEIKEIKNKIYNARVYINANFDVSKDPQGKNMSDKVLEAFETEHSAGRPLRQTHASNRLLALAAAALAALPV